MPGTLPAKVADPVEHIVCAPPADEAVGGELTVIVTFEAEAVQGASLIVHVST